MTPDQARALLDGTTPGPWRLQEVKGHPNLRHITTGTGHSGDPTAAVCIPVDVTSREGAANMAAKAAVPSMLATLAGMRAEYAVQNRVGDKWLYEDADGRNLAPYDSHRISWWPDPIPQSDIADRGEGMARIVRRYVTEPEEA